MTPEDDQQSSDSELISAIAQGDMTSWEQLMTRYTSKAYQIAYGILGNNHDAEEVTQDAFLRIYKALEKFRGDAEFSTWMYRIVVNQARNKYRWNKRRGSDRNISISPDPSEENASSSFWDIPDERDTPDKEIMLRELKERIQKEMEKLPEVNREALILRNGKNFSYEKIAKILDCKIGTVKSRIARAREELRKRLGRYT